MQDLIQQILGYLRGMWHRRWIGLAVAWVVVIIGGVGVFRLPDQFEASARVYVDTQSMLRPLMAGMAITPDASGQVAILSRTLLSRPNIEKIIRKSDLDTSARASAESLVDNTTAFAEDLALRLGRQHLYDRLPVYRPEEGARRRAGSALDVHRAEPRRIPRRHRQCAQVPRRADQAVRRTAAGSRKSREPVSAQVHGPVSDGRQGFLVADGSGGRANQGREGGASRRRADAGWNTQTAAGTDAGAARGEPGHGGTDRGAGTRRTDCRNAAKDRRGVAQLHGRTP